MTDITLADFLRARLDEMAAPREREAWHETFCLDPTDRTSDGRCLYCGATPDPAKVELVEQSPRVLAQVAAMRAIVADCADYIGSEAVTDGLSARTLERFAAVWSSHPDYDPAWAPEGE